MTIGESITLEELERDPYPIYARLREEEPVSWVPGRAAVARDPLRRRAAGGPRPGDLHRARPTPPR